MSPIRTQGRWVLLATLAAPVLGLVAVGWLLGMHGTKSPSLPYYQHAAVTTYADAQNVEVLLLWELRSDATAMIKRIPTNDDFSNSRTVTIVLDQVTRFKEITPPARDEEVEVTIADYGDYIDECNGPLATAPPHECVRSAIQVLTFGPVVNNTEPDEIPYSRSISGRLSGSWTSSAGGERIARAPGWHNGLRDPIIRSGFSSESLYGVSTKSELLSKLSGTTDEIVTQYIPNDLSGDYDVSLDARASSRFSEFPGIYWAKKPSDKYSGLGTTFARWDVPSQAANAQRELLLSGVLLGIAASVVIEFLFMVGRNVVRSGRSAE